MNTLPVVTIVIPFYNNEDTLLLAIKSVFAQTYKNWKLILLNDGSKDNSLSIANSINDNRVKVVSDGVNKGLIFRLNQAPTLTDSQYIARMDADDLMRPERIAKQMQILINNPDIDLVDTATYSISEKEQPLGIRGLAPINTNPKQMIGKAILLHASIVGKTDWFLKNKYDNNYLRGEDCELWIRTLSNSKFCRVQEPLYIVREGKVNVRNYILGIKATQKILKNYKHLYLSNIEYFKLILITYIKIVIYKLFGLFNKQDIISKTRNKILSSEESLELENIINKIKSVQIN